MKLRAYGLKNGDTFLHDGKEYRVTEEIRRGTSGHVRATGHRTEIMVSAQTLVEATGSIFPSRDADIKRALNIQES